MPLADVALLLDCPQFQLPGGINVRRRAASVAQINEFAEYKPAAGVLLNFRPAMVHNLTGRARVQPPDSDRNEADIAVYTKVRLFDADDGNEPDVIEGYNGRNYRVSLARDYSIQGGVFISEATLTEATTP